MAWTVAPRNTTTKDTHQASASSISATLTVTAVVAGDLCVVAVGIIGVISTVTPPSGFTLVAGSQGTRFYASNKVAAGTTSLTFSATGSLMTDLGLIYAAWPGGSAYSPFSEGASGPVNNNTTPLPTVTSSGHTIPGDLAVWLGGSSGSGPSAAPGNPTGTGTWTSVNTVFSSGNLGMRMSAQIDATTANQVASGAACTGSTNSTALIVAFPPNLGKFFALMGG